MPLSPGDKLGHYEITSLLGQGGMGEVYRARDTQLKREVALKVLAPAFASDADRVARFQREAEVLASLNHPNIAALYGLAESGGVRALVMELVEGETPQGPMSFDDAWKIAHQVAEGLEYAHERGIIHRDLKPANLKVTPDGRVKILDFGLAKALAGPARQTSAAGGANSPTLTMGATQAGVILGTAAYMAPEQIRGKEADRRADIWAFGVVLYEFLTAERPFPGSDATEIMARAVTSEPVLDKAPPRVQRLLAECLKKEPADRLGWIGDARKFLTPDQPARSPTATTPPRSRFPWAVAALGLTLAAALAAWTAFHQPAEPQSFHYSIEAPPNIRFANAYFNTAISPDGRFVVYGANRTGTAAATMWLRALDSLDARELPGTEAGNGAFWSPDSKSIGFAAGGKLKRIDIAGGAPQVLCDAAGFQGGTWSQNGTILFSSGNVLQKVSSSGGAPAPVTALDPARQETWHRFPSFLPGGNRFLFTILGQAGSTQGVYTASLDAPKERTRLVSSDAKALYAPPRNGHPGYLLWLRDQTLLAQRFDGKSRVQGDPVPVAQPVSKLNSLNRAPFWISENGILLYRSGSQTLEQMYWLNRDGKPDSSKSFANLELGDPSISPDASRIALHRGANQGPEGSDIWTYEVARGVLTRLTFGQGSSQGPVWSPDGRRIAYSNLRKGTRQIYVKDSAGAGQEQPLIEGPNVKYVRDWSRDGRYILYEEQDPKNGRDGRDIWALPLWGDRKPIPLLQTEFNETNPQFSPDGKWFAYQSDESGANQIYIQPFPPSGGKWQISTNGGIEPRWRGDGKELYFLAAGQIWAAGIRTTASRLDADAPQALFPVVTVTGPAYTYDVTRDGQHFVVIEPPEETSGQTNAITVVTNWQAALQ